MVKLQVYSSQFIDQLNQNPRIEFSLCNKLYLPFTNQPRCINEAGFLALMFEAFQSLMDRGSTMPQIEEIYCKLIA